jgi:hypothetical protein
VFGVRLEITPFPGEPGVGIITMSQMDAVFGVKALLVSP